MSPELYDPDCLFCRIIEGSEPSKKVLELENFLVIENKYPVAPIHVLVVDKNHREKSQTISGAYKDYWDDMHIAIYDAIKHLGLDKTGYKLVNTGAGYNHFEHEHVHIMGGTDTEPGGQS